jgi:hypothetical protein
LLTRLAVQPGELFPWPNLIRLPTSSQRTMSAADTRHKAGQGVLRGQTEWQVLGWTPICHVLSFERMTTAETHSLGEYKALLHDFASLATHCFRELNPRTLFAPSWHHEFIAANWRQSAMGISRG